jgi:hypothetical protein
MLRRFGRDQRGYTSGIMRGLRGEDDDSGVYEVRVVLSGMRRGI